MNKEYKRELVKLFKKESPAYFAEDASITSQARILLNKLARKFDKIFNVEGIALMDKMVSDVDRNTQATVKESLKDLAGITINTKDLNKETREVLKAGSEQAANYIKSIQSQYLTDVQGAVYRSITEGEGLKDLIPALEKYEGMTKRRAKNIALDQTRKTNATLSQARMSQAGIKKFKWNHSGGSKNPRENHMEWDGKIFSFDDLPYDKDLGQRVYVGQAPYCGCFATPLIEFDEE
jgi:SPP1 gp7 family putative phage head morphogenesis protein